MTAKAKSLLAALQNAESLYFQAQQLCNHWDMEGNDGDHDCCHQLDEARQMKQAAQRAFSRANRC